MIVRSSRLLGRGLASAALAGLSLVTALVLSLRRRVTGPTPAFFAWRRRVYRRWAEAVCRTFGAKVEHSGAIPEPPFLLVSNHLGYLDIAVMASLCPARFVAKSEIRRWPIAGWLCRAVDTIFVDRTSRRDVVRVERDMVGALEEGDGVILFPEGTSGRGDEVMPFKPSLFAWPAREGRSVWLATLHYETPEEDPAPDLCVAWWGTMSFVPHLVRMLQLREIRAHVTFAPRPVVGRDRKQLAEAARAEVESHFVPLRSTPSGTASEG